MSICQVCSDCVQNHKGILHDSDTEGQLFFCHHFTVESLGNSAGTGWPICSLLWMELKPVLAKKPYVPKDSEPLSFLLLSTPDAFSLEGSYILSANLNSDAVTIDGIEQASIKLWSLQESRGKVCMT